MSALATCRSRARSFSVRFSFVLAALVGAFGLPAAAVVHQTVPTQRKRDIPVAGGGDEDYDIMWESSTSVAGLPAAFAGDNPANGLRTYFTPSGLCGVPLDATATAAPWRLDLELTAFGDQGDLQSVPAAVLAPSKNGIDFIRPVPIAERYVNSADGLEQTYMLTAPPGGTATGAAPIFLEFALEGSLVPSLETDGRTLTLSMADGAAVVQYEAFRATDAGGNALYVHVELIAGASGTVSGMRLVVPENKGVYPITVQFDARSPEAGSVDGGPAPTPEAVPANDQCGAATVLMLDMPITGTTVEANNDYALSSSAPTCFTFPTPPAPVGQTPSTTPGRDVAYRFQAPTAGTYSLRVTGYSPAQNVVVYVTNACPTGTSPITVTTNPPCIGGANRNTSNGAEEVVCVSLSALQTVYVFVDDNTSANAGSTFTIEVNRCTRETEANDTPATADAIACPVEGATGTSNDVDFFSIGTPATQSRVFTLTDAISGNSDDFQSRTTTLTDTLEFDDDDGDVIFGSSGFSPVIGGTRLTGVASYIRMDHHFGSIAEPYRLYSLVEPPIASATVEIEPNDTVGSAQATANDYITGTLTASNVDVFGFCAAKGDLIFAGMDCDPAYDNTPIDGTLALLDNTGATLITVNGSFSASSVRAPVLASLVATTPIAPAEALVWRARYGGVYYAKTSASATGDYLLGIGTNCSRTSGSADLMVSKLDNLDPVAVGGNLTYSVTVTNTGSAAACGLVVTDPLPGSTTFLAITAGSYTCTTPAVGTSGTVTCRLDFLGAGQSASFSIDVKVKFCLGNGTTLTNTVSVAGLKTDPTPGNNSATATTTVTDPGCDDGNVCTVDGCDPSSGCTHGPCDDGNACTVGDLCSGVTCTPGGPRNCDDGNVCTVDGCNPSSGCTHTDNTAACNDGDPCTVGESCRSGICVAPLSLTQASGSPILVESIPRFVAAGDWNGDGEIDLAVSNSGFSDVTILLGNGSGGFSYAAPVAVGNNPYGIAVGDWNGDGKLDLAVANEGFNSVTILLGDGSGGFSSAGSRVVGSSPHSIVAGDFDRDGDSDLAVANFNSNSVTILLGDGSGGFSSAGSIVVGTNPIDVAVGDFNRDGDLDLAVANLNSNSVTILLGNGSGGFSSAGSVAVGTDPESIAVGDLDRDGDLDLAVAIYSSNSVKILLGDGTGGFSSAGSVMVGTHPFSVVAGDVNRDGDLDLAVANSDSNSVTILLGNGTGGFSSAGSVAVGSIPGSIAAGDLNRDGKLDLAVANEGSTNVTILLNNSSCQSGICLAPVFTQPSGSPIAAGSFLRSVASGDFDRDGDLDLAVTSNLSHDVTILLGNGSGGFSSAPGSPIAVGTSPRSVAAGDVNGDGKLDLAVANNGSSSVTILLGNGSGGFSAAPGSPVTVPAGPSYVAIGDVNRDGKLDLAVASQASNNFTILLGDGSGGFSAGGPLFVAGGPISIAVGDWNGDGKLDLALAAQSSSNVAIRLGNGSGGFSTPPGSPVAVGSSPRSVAAGDLNGDGKLDLVVANHNSSDLTILVGNGSGGFSAAPGSPVALGTSPDFVAVGDMNGDGKLDLGVANSSSNKVTILMGNGSGGFIGVPGSPVAVGSTPSSLAVGDLNNDGKLELAVAHDSSSPNNVTILLSTATSTASDGTSCNDGNACTANETCTGGVCSGTPAVPAEVDNGVRVARNGGAAVISWNLASGATKSAVLRGLESALPVGPGGGDETCLASDLPSTTLTWMDAVNPATGACFWYLVRGDNVCGKGPYGFQAQNGIPTVARVTTTCP